VRIDDEALKPTAGGAVQSNNYAPGPRRSTAAAREEQTFLVHRCKKRKCALRATETLILFLNWRGSRLAIGHGRDLRQCSTKPCAVRPKARQYFEAIGQK
jgi:hypothetical protein